jgi:hypothetical protein
MPTINKAKRNFTVSLFTSLAMVAIVLGYILYFLPQNQQRLESRNFRVLSRIGNNLHQSLYASVTGISRLEKEQDSERQRSFLDSIYGGGIAPAINTAEEKKGITGRVHLYQNYNKDYIQTVGYGTGASASHQVSPNSYELHIKTDQFHYPINLNNLLLPLLRDDVFEEFYIFKEGAGDKDNSNLKPQNLIYSTSLININIFSNPAADKENPHQQGTAGNVLNIDLAGKAYKLFVIKQEVGYGQKWVLCGAVPAPEYQAKRLAIPNDVIGWLVIALIFLLLGLPFIKLMLLTKTERLHLGHIVSCIVFLYAGASIFFLLWLNANAYYGPDKDIRENQLKNLAATINKSFIYEIEKALVQTSLIDTSQVITDHNNLPGAEITTVNNSGNQPTNYPVYPFFTRISWISSAGKQTAVYPSKKGVSHLMDVKDRPYFRLLVEGNGWRLPGSQEDFYLNKIKSYKDGENYVVISRKSLNKKKNAAVVTMTTKMVSLTEAVLPPHFGFMIIDEEGEVLFHSNNKLDLNENFIQETNQNFNVRAAIQNNIPYHFDTYYQGSRKNMFISTVTGLPLYVVAFVDKEHIKYRYLNTFVLSNSLFLFYLVLLGVLVAIILIAVIQPAKLPFHQLSLNWLRPQPRNNLAYKKICGFLAVAILGVAFITNDQTADAIFFLLLLVPFYVFLFAYYALNNLEPQVWQYNPIARWVLRLLFLVIFLLNGVYLFFIGLYVYNLSLSGLVTFYTPVFITQLFLILTWWILEKHGPKLFGSNPTGNKMNYRIQLWYNVMVLLVICLTSTLPAVIFYKDAYNRESEQMLQYHQLYLERAIRDHEKNIPFDPGEGDKVVEANFGKSKSRIYAQFFYQTRHVHNSISKNEEKAENKPINNLKKVTEKVSGLSINRKENLNSAPVLTRSLATISSGIFPAPENNTVRSDENPTNQDKVIDHFFAKVCPVLHLLLNSSHSEDLLICQAELANQRRFGYADKTLYLPPRGTDGSTSVANLEVSPTDGHFYSSIPYFNLLPQFWLNAFIFLIFLFLVIQYLSSRIFNITYTSNLKLSKVDQQLLSDFQFDKILLISVPGTFEDNQTRFKNLVADFQNYELINIDLAKEDDFISRLNVLTAKEKVVVWVRHFSFQAFEKDALDKKLLLLNRLANQNFAKIILQTSDHPGKWEEKWKQKELSAEIEDEMRQLLDLISQYWKVFQPLRPAVGCLTKNNITSRPMRNELDYQKQALRDLVRAECNSCTFLKPLQPFLLDYVEEKCETKLLKKSDIVLKIQSLAHMYYRMLWSSCTKEEQYMLYDTAEDGVVNAHNIGVLTSLLSKGLMVKDETQVVRLFNESFRNFVLTTISPEEALRYEKENNVQSKWDVYKVPLFIILIGAATFIFVTQQETWLTVLALLTGVSSLLTVLPRFGFLIPALFLKKEAK